MGQMVDIEQIPDSGSVLAYVIRTTASAAATTFITPDEATFQAGFVVYPAGGEVVPHLHLPVRREVVGTSELLFVRSGRCHVDVYDSNRQIVATRELGPGDAVLSLGGGHGFRMIEDTVLLELKQGPFIGGMEKVRFERPADVAEGP
jgi:hypothetical protein